MAVALAHLRVAERRHGEASFRSGTTSRSPAISPRSISRGGPPPRPFILAKNDEQPAVAGPHPIQRGEGRERQFTGQAKSRARGHIHSPVLVLVQSPSMGTLTGFPASPQSKHRPGASRVQNPELPFDNLDSGRVQVRRGSGL
jgi:hypothetical protein